jgi:hypothetical protein
MAVGWRTVPQNVGRNTQLRRVCYLEGNRQLLWGRATRLAPSGCYLYVVYL